MTGRSHVFYVLHMEGQEAMPRLAHGVSTLLHSVNDIDIAH